MLNYIIVGIHQPWSFVIIGNYSMGCQESSPINPSHPAKPDISNSVQNPAPHWDEAQKKQGE